MTTNIDAMVFDIGEVLLNTGARHLYRKLFTDEQEMEYFLANVLTSTLRSSWNLSANVEAEVEQLAVLHPKYAMQIRAFFLRFEETVAGTVAGMSELVRTIDPAIRLFALSNWGGDTFSKVAHMIPERKRFVDIIISGAVGMKKPDTRIFTLARDRFGVVPSRTIFIDDKVANVEASKKLGFIGMHFVGAPALRTSLTAHNIVINRPKETS